MFRERNADQFVVFQRIAQFVRTGFQYPAGEGGTEFPQTEMSADMIAVCVRAEQCGQGIGFQSFRPESWKQDGIHGLCVCSGVDEYCLAAVPAHQHDTAPRSAERCFQK